jgi:sugar/nucleoside kinase (ribokinase family)
VKSTVNLVIGNYNVDIVLYPVNVLPAWGEERVCDLKLVRSAGSAGYTVLALGALGLPPEAIGNVGNDFYGRLVLDALERSGARTEHIQQTDCPTGISITMTNDAGERAFVTYHGHLDRLCVDAVIQGIRSVPRAGYCLLAGYFLLRNVGPRQAIDILRACKRQGGTTMLDVGFDPEGWEPGTVESIRRVLGEVDVFCPNYQEAVAVSGVADMSEVTHVLLDLGPEMVFVKNGDKGSWFGSRTITPITAEAFPVRAFDTTGAGDAFNAGVIYGLSSGWEPRRILSFANAVAAITLSRREDRYPSLGEVNRFLDERGLE